MDLNHQSANSHMVLHKAFLIGKLGYESYVNFVNWNEKLREDIFERNDKHSRFTNMPFGALMHMNEGMMLHTMTSRRGSAPDLASIIIITQHTSNIYRSLL